MFEAERQAIRETFKLSRPTVRETLLVAALYSGQATACVIVLFWVYRHLTAHHGDTWAIISAILALQPSRRQSVVTSLIRILANTVGASVGLVVGEVLVHLPNEWQIILSIAIVVPVCELLRLNLALRTACVAAIIVLAVGGGLDGNPKLLKTTGEERFVATVIGCGSALLVQAATDLARKAIGQRSGEPTTIERS
jgi:uncharacterized membrane protein YgaE (UPF0421/DUF939 family)